MDVLSSLALSHGPLWSSLFGVFFISFVPIAFSVLLYTCAFQNHSYSYSNSNSNWCSIVQKTKFRTRCTKILVAFAVGGLLGDAMIHLIPHAFQHEMHMHMQTVHMQTERALHMQTVQMQMQMQTFTNGHSQKTAEISHPAAWTTIMTNNPHNHDAMEKNLLHHQNEQHKHQEHEHLHVSVVGMKILAGMMGFFFIERLVRSISHKKTHTSWHAVRKIGIESKSNASRTRKHSDAQIRWSDNESESDEDTSNINVNDLRRRHTTTTSDLADTDLDRIESDNEETVTDERAVGLLNVIGDIAHNFTDGMAIAASFATSPQLGISTTLAVLVHEVPHEIGDIAILLQSGWSLSSALRTQLITAIGALVGVLFSFYTFHVRSDITQLLLPLTAGGFIYIALVNVMPTLNNSQLSLGQTLLEVIGMTAGVGLMYFISIVLD